jgi:hypothetical protein
MILIASSPHDTTAPAIADGLGRCGVDARVVHRLDAVRFTLGPHQASVLAPTVTYHDPASDSGPGATVSGILNRGLFSATAPLEGSPEADRVFLDGEADAAVWALVGLFAGPVVNRPDGSGPLGTIDTSVMARALRWQLPERRFLDDPRDLEGLSPGSWNVHRWPGRAFVGRVPSAGPLELGPDGTCYLATRFTPERTATLLLAGRTCFMPSSSDGSVAPEFLDAARGLETDAAEHGPRLVSVVVESSDAAPPTLLWIQPTPMASSYARITESVHRSLAEALR